MSEDWEGPNDVSKQRPMSGDSEQMTGLLDLDPVQMAPVFENTPDIHSNGFRHDSLHNAVVDQFPQRQELHRSRHNSRQSQSRHRNGRTTQWDGDR
jgi:hypothetical protein